MPRSRVFNCDPEETARLAVPAERLRLCLTLMTAVKLQDADVELCTEKPVLIYERSPVLAGVFPALASFGFQVVAVDDLRPYANSFFIFQLLFLPVANVQYDAARLSLLPRGKGASRQRSR